MSMCVARPENASLQPPTSVFPTPCASGRSVQQGNAVQVTLGLTARCSSCTRRYFSAKAGVDAPAPPKIAP